MMICGQNLFKLEVAESLVELQCLANGKSGVTNGNECGMRFVAAS